LKRSNESLAGIELLRGLLPGPVVSQEVARCYADEDRQYCRDDNVAPSGAVARRTSGLAGLRSGGEDEVRTFDHERFPSNVGGAARVAMTGGGHRLDLVASWSGPWEG
jgi:hypothetical protein